MQNDSHIGENGKGGLRIPSKNYTASWRGETTEQEKKETEVEGVDSRLA